ncbi:MAG: APC family permease [Thermoproteus sp.]|jgi:APA family basic amino acid/polyamine antiporter|nr:APC family permease [Thermoproteus sp.]MDT7881330.1 APC family permease [Thermoproteus sp.]
MSRDWLRRRLNVFDIYSLVHADSQSTFYFILGVIAAKAGRYTFLVVLYGTALMIAIALAYGEMGSRFPETGGSYLYVKTALGRTLGFFSAWLLALDQAIMVAYGSLDGVLYLANMLSYYGVDVPYLAARALSFLVALGLFAITLIGIKESARAATAIALLDIAVVGVLTVLLGLAASLRTPPPYFSWGNVPPSDVWAGLSYASRGYTGMDAIGQLAGEAEMPLVQVPRAAALAAGLGALYGVGLTALLMNSVAYPAVVSNPATAVVQIAASMPYGRWLVLPAGVVTAVVQIMAALAGFIAFSRLLYKLAEEQLLPAVFSKVHRRFRTPYVSLVLSAAVASALLAPGEIYLIVDVYAISSLINYLLVSISLLVVVRRGDLYGAVRSPTVKGISLVGAVGVITTLAGVLLSTLVRYGELWIIGLWALAGALLLLRGRKKGVRPVK